MAKYYTKIQTISQFEEDVLPNIEGTQNDTNEFRKQAWDVFLKTLHKDGKITKTQRETWIFPQRDKVG